MSGQSAGEELPYIGSKISLISSSDIRYEGILDAIDPLASTVSLRFVQSFGTEGRPAASPVPPSNEIYNCIVFQGKHIKDLTVCSEPEPPPPAMAPYPPDPAIVSVDMSGPAGAPGGPGAAPLMAPGVGPPPHAGGSGGMPPVFGGLGAPPDTEVAEACCAPVAPQLRGPPHQPHLQPPHSGDGNVGRQGGRQQNMQGGRDNNGGGGNRSAGRGGRTRGGRDNRRPGRGGDGGRRYPDQPRGVVGELQGRPNPQLKSELAEEFDFDAMNSKFEKPAALEEASELPAPGSAYDKTLSFFDSISCEALDKRAGAQQQQQGGGGGGAEDGRSRRGANRQQNHALDVDTFGEGAAHYNARHMGARRGGRGRGRGYSRGGGGQGGNRGGRGGGAGPSNQRHWAQRNNNNSNKPNDAES
ncbi:hypothetical protein ACSSS7_004141 [Eimeria intestinalis]